MRREEKHHDHDHDRGGVCLQLECVCIYVKVRNDSVYCRLNIVKVARAEIPMLLCLDDALLL